MAVKWRRTPATTQPTPFFAGLGRARTAVALSVPNPPELNLSPDPDEVPGSEESDRVWNSGSGSTVGCSVGPGSAAGFAVGTPGWVSVPAASGMPSAAGGSSGTAEGSLCG